MNYNLTLKINSIVTMLIGLATIPAIIVALMEDDQDSLRALLIVFSVCFCLGLYLSKETHEKKITVRSGEEYFITLLCWLMACFIGAFPFYLSLKGYSFIDCLFESTTGFTTTGCSAIPTDQLSDALIMWKATTHWLGGMGILILMVSMFSFLGISGVSMATAEAPGPTLDKTKSRAMDTSKFLYTTYTIFTLAEFLLFLPSGMPIYDAIVNALSSISTGGLIIRDSAAVFFQSGYVRIIVSIFSVISAMNYMLYFYVVTRDFKQIKKVFELKYFLIVIIVSSVLIVSSLFISGHYSSFKEAFSDGIFEAIAASSTSGYTICEYDKWPAFAQFVLIIQMFIGGCANSTSGSIKVIRFVVILNLIKRGIYKRIHPHSVMPIRIGDNIISTENTYNITLFTFLYFGMFFLGCVILSLDNKDIFTTLSTNISILSNAGMNFGEIGITGDYNIYSTGSKIYLIALMTAGRLEIYSLIFIFSRSFWKQNKSNF